MQIAVAEFGQELQDNWEVLTQSSPVPLGAVPKIYLCHPGEHPAAELPADLTVHQVSSVYNVDLQETELCVIFQDYAGNPSHMLPYAVLSTQDPSASTASRRYARTLESWFMDNPGPHEVSSRTLDTEAADETEAAVAQAIVDQFNSGMVDFQHGNANNV